MQWNSEMHVYDSLPSAIRKALREADDNLSPGIAARMLSLDKTAQDVVDAINRAGKAEAD